MKRWRVIRALAMVGVVAAACGGAPSPRSAPRDQTEPRAAPRPVPAVDVAATPTGWTPVDDGAAQVSLPPGWLVTSGGCVSPEARGTLEVTPPGGPSAVVGPTPSCIVGPGAPARLGPVVKIGPIDLTVPAAHPPARLVHGIPVEVAAETACALSGPCPTWYVVPSLGVEIVDDEVPGDLTPVIDTLTRSPRGLTLTEGAPPPVPAPWHRVSFGGVSVAVPSSWPVSHQSNAASDCSWPDLALSATGALLDQGTSDVLPSCPAVVGGEPPPVPALGVLIDPGRYGPLSSTTTFGLCREIHGLRVCPATSDPFGILVVAVHLPGRVTPVALEIGLAGIGTTSRTVLDSLRAG